jgi:hypothetical protein
MVTTMTAPASCLLPVRWLLFFALLSVLNACGGGGGQGGNEPVLVSVAITPRPAATGVGIAQQLNATGTYSDSSTKNITTDATWTSDTPTIATVGSTTGVATGVSIGSAKISATVGSVSGMVRLSVVTKSWISTGDMQTARAAHSATMLSNGTVLIAGGCCDSLGNGLAGAEIYNPSAGTWTRTGMMTKARVGHTATLLPNGKVLIAGGDSAPTAEIYDPSNGTWTSTGSMTTRRADHTATLLPNGKILVVGGEDIIAVLASTEIYDSSTGSWTSTGSLSTPRYMHTATLLPKGTILVSGGQESYGSFLLSAEIYDPTTGAWTGTGSMGAPAGPATLLTNGTALSIGTPSEIYDPSTGAWTSTGSLVSDQNLGIPNETATLLLNGTVLAVGGLEPNSPGPNLYTNPLVDAEIYEPAAGTWIFTANMKTGHSGNTATMLSNGTVLVAGGVCQGASQIPTSCHVISAAEIYFP